MLILLVNYKDDKCYFATPSVGNDYIKLTLLVSYKDDNDYFATPSVGNDYIMLTLLDGDKDDNDISDRRGCKVTIVIFVTNN
jgi:hypothetical protein